MRFVAFAALLVALNAQAQSKRASASNSAMTGFFTLGAPFADTYAAGTGEVQLEAIDRGRTDAGRLTARFAVNGDRYTVELDAAGLAKQEGPGHALSGGVVIDQLVRGDLGLGYPTTSPVRAAVAMRGQGRVTKNGALVSDRALVIGLVLATGVHADDGSFRLLPESRERDTEIHVLALGLPSSQVASGFLQFAFDDVRVSVDGADVASVAFVPTVSPRLPEESGMGGSGGVGYPSALGGVAPLPSGSMGDVPGAVIGQVTDVSAPSGGLPVNPAPALPLTQTPSPTSTAPATPLPSTPSVQETAPATALVETPTPPNAAPALPLTGRTAPPNPATALPLPQTPAPANATPATPLVGTERPLNATPANPFLPQGEIPLNTMPLPAPTPTTPAPVSGGVVDRALAPSPTTTAPGATPGAPAPSGTSGTAPGSAMPGSTAPSTGGPGAAPSASPTGTGSSFSPGGGSSFGFSR
jgi:hypothetical protein